MCHRPQSLSEGKMRSIISNSRDISEVLQVFGNYRNNQDENQKAQFQEEVKRIEERAKKESSLFEAFYKAKQPSMLNFKIERILKFNSKFQLEVYKVNPMKFLTYFSLKDIEKITRKEESHSVKVFCTDVMGISQLEKA